MVGQDKTAGAVFVDLTFSTFKLLIGEIAKDTGASKPSQEALKMIFDQLKTQLKSALKEQEESTK